MCLLYSRSCNRFRVFCLVTCIYESLLITLEAKMETYRHSTGSQFNVCIIRFRIQQI